MTKAQAKKIKELTPLIQSIKSRCLDCCANSQYEVKMCRCSTSVLFPYRLGLNSVEAKTTNKKERLAVEMTAEEEVKDG